jgi:exonuclease SbcC
MIPVELQVWNFLAYQDPGPLRLDGIRVACLAGPNGAGKSSLLDAMTWCIWGKARSNSADELIHQGKDEMRVNLTFDQAGTRYRILRQRKSGKRGASLLEFQVWEAETENWAAVSEGSIRETQERIDQTLRLDYDTFVNSAFLVQGRADEFTTKTPGQRKQVLANVLGLSIWEAYEARAKERMQATRDQIQRIEGRLEEVERELARRDEHGVELAAAQAAAVQADERLGAAEAQWAEQEHTRSELLSTQRQLDDLTRRMASRVKDLAEAHDEVAGELARADKVALEAARAESQRDLEALDRAQQSLEDAMRRRSDSAEESARLKGINQLLGPETEPIKTRAQTLESASEPICPTCGQPLTDEHRHQLLNDLNAEIGRRRESYRANLDKIKARDEEQAQLSLQMKDLQTQLAGRNQVERRLASAEADLKHADEAQVRVERLQARIAEWEAQLAEDEAARAEFTRQADATQAQLNALTLTAVEVERLRLEKRRADERVGGARQQLAAAQAMENQRLELRKSWDQQTEELALLDDLRGAFSKRGVPAMIIETVVPELERTANELLSRLTDGRLNVRIETQREIKTGDLREALDIIISDELGSRPYELYSGGEAFRINFAIRIALSRLLARRSGAQLRSLFIDEGFGTQDASGREHLVEALNSIQDDFDRILVITHIDELRDAFPARIEVHKTDHGSVFSLS